MNLEEIKKEISRADKALKSAEVLIQKSYYEDAISRCYYGALHAARALLLIENINIGSHQAVRRLFGKNFIKTGKLDKKYAKILAEVQDNRYRADYDVIYSATQEDAEDSLEEANDFFAEIREYLKKEINL
jgi:uncharacterized protein